MGQAPTSQAKPRGKDQLRPSNQEAWTLPSVVHTPSKFGHDACPVRRAEHSWRRSVLYANVFFAAWTGFRAGKKKKSGLQQHKDEILFISCFPCRPAQQEQSISQEGFQNTWRRSPPGLLSLFPLPLKEELTSDGNHCGGGGGGGSSTGVNLLCVVTFLVLWPSLALKSDDVVGVHICTDLHRAPEQRTLTPANADAREART